MAAIASASAGPGLYTGSSRKRRNNEDPFFDDGAYPSDSKHSRPVMWYYVLESESNESDESSESVYSIQEKSTDCAKDTSDTSSSSDESHQMVEYEVASLISEPVYPFPDDDSSSAPEEGTGSLRVLPLKARKGDKESGWESSSSSQLTESTQDDPELSRADFWTCLRCRQRNNNPLYRFCERCFKVRKNFFPPRPKHKRLKSRKKLTRPSDSEGAHAQQDSGLGEMTSGTEPSQEILKTSEEEEPNVPPTTESQRTSPVSLDLCSVCYVAPRDGGFVHTNFVHVYSCYKCSLKVLKLRAKCPICNLKCRQVVRVSYG